jgi:hypothetical protein
VGGRFGDGTVAGVIGCNPPLSIMKIFDEKS